MMDHGSYWHGYFMARHHVFLILGIILMVVALVSALTGTTLVKFQGIVHRADDPKTFWESVVVDCLLGLIWLGLFLYTLN